MLNEKRVIGTLGGSRYVQLVVHDGRVDRQTVNGNVVEKSETIARLPPNETDVEVRLLAKNVFSDCDSTNDILDFAQQYVLGVPLIRHGCP